MNAYKEIDKLYIKKAIESSPVDGHIVIDVKNNSLDFNGSVKCFGVKKYGGLVKGEGVLASRIISEDNKTRLLFSIANLVKNYQISQKTKELVIKIDGREIYRKKIINLPNLYL